MSEPTTQSLALSDYLQARWAEIEQTAREATPGPWRWAHLAVYAKPNYGLVGALHPVDQQPQVVLPAPEPWPQKADAEHIATHDPAYVLADIAAKRAILDEHALILRDVGWWERDEDGDLVECLAELSVCRHCVPRHSYFDSRDDVPEGHCITIRLLAQPFSTRDDFQDEWRV